MTFSNPRETGGKIAIKDEGVTLTPRASSVDFAGAGVTGAAVGNDVTETIPGGGASLTKEIPVGDIDGVNKVFTTTNAPQIVVLGGQIQDEGVGNDFVLSGTYTLTFTEAPKTNQKLITYY